MRIFFRPSARGALAAICACLLAVPTLAQTYRSTGAARGSEGPSQYLGVVGGANTLAAQPQNARRPFLPGGSIGPYQTSRVGSYTGLGGGRNIAEIPSMLLPSQPMLPAATRPSFSVLASTNRHLTSLRYASGFENSMELYTPLRGWPVQDLTSLRTPIAAPEPRRSAYETYFGLAAKDEVRTGQAAGVGLTGADLLNDVVESRARSLLARLREAFRQATTTATADRFDKLDEAAHLVNAARSLNPDDHVAALLGVHAALERNLVPLAAEFLFDAVRRRPELFVEGLDVAPYFGDRKVLDAQIDRFVLEQTADIDPDSAAIQAYCAWLRRDVVRLDRFLETGLRVAEGTPRMYQMEALATALRVSLR